MIKIVQWIIDMHHRKVFITCDEDCWCWRLQEWVIRQELKEGEK